MINNVVVATGDTTTGKNTQVSSCTFTADLQLSDVIKVQVSYTGFAPTVNAGSGTYIRTSAPASTVEPEVNLPAPTGPYRIGAQDVFLTQTGRSDPFVPANTRRISTTVWYPTTASFGRMARYLSEVSATETTMATKDQATHASGGPAPAVMVGKVTHSFLNAPVRTDLGLLPVVMYSPGLNVGKEHGTAICEELASYGYVVISIACNYESPATEFPDALYFTDTRTETPAIRDMKLYARIDDARYVMDKLTDPAVFGNGIAGLVDASKVGMMGHSNGGWTAIEVAAHDARLKCCLDYDGQFTSSGQVNYAFNNGVDQPLMAFIEQGITSADWSAFKSRIRGPLYQIELAGSKHYAFTDLVSLADSSLSGTITPARAHICCRAYTRAFFDKHLKGSAQVLLDGPSGTYPEVSFNTLG
ncbi:alpha/beta hydrolase family protein [Antrihabitans cavernicola]|uniref:alpha/beta hydrolase family protein n=1 Tax=Antrihabitans cavernicola TaxID=2495913 RepID=UPI0016599C48|nr:dienelactone hydrolase family protein [Spelaeibacter cavernicola]